MEAKRGTERLVFGKMKQKGKEEGKNKQNTCKNIL